jgi:hypothetical protein
MGHTFAAAVSVRRDRAVGHRAGEFDNEELPVQLHARSDRGEQKGLHAGEFCARRYQRQYRRYHHPWDYFVSDRWHPEHSLSVILKASWSKDCYGPPEFWAFGRGVIAERHPLRRLLREYETRTRM